jgi:hypothetical protein
MSTDVTGVTMKLRKGIKEVVENYGSGKLEARKRTIPIQTLGCQEMRV